MENNMSLGSLTGSMGELSRIQEEDQCFQQYSRVLGMGFHEACESYCSSNEERMYMDAAEEKKEESYSGLMPMETCEDEEGEEKYTINNSNNRKTTKSSVFEEDKQLDLILLECCKRNWFARLEENKKKLDMAKVYTDFMKELGLRSKGVEISRTTMTNRFKHVYQSKKGSGNKIWTDFQIKASLAAEKRVRKEGIKPPIREQIQPPITQSTQPTPQAIIEFIQSSVNRETGTLDAETVSSVLEQLESAFINSNLGQESSIHAFNGILFRVALNEGEAKAKFGEKMALVMTPRGPMLQRKKSDRFMCWTVVADTKQKRFRKDIPRVHQIEEMRSTSNIDNDVPSAVVYYLGICLVNQVNAKKGQMLQLEDGGMCGLALEDSNEEGFVKSFVWMAAEDKRLFKMYALRTILDLNENIDEELGE